MSLRKTKHHENMFQKNVVLTILLPWERRQEKSLILPWERRQKISILVLTVLLPWERRQEKSLHILSFNLCRKKHLWPTQDGTGFPGRPGYGGSMRRHLRNTHRSTHLSVMNRKHWWPNQDGTGFPGRPGYGETEDFDQRTFIGRDICWR